MASRALTARFMITCSMWAGSTLTGWIRIDEARFQLDVLADDAAQHLLDLVDHVIEGDYAGHRHLAAAEGQQLVGEVRGAIARRGRSLRRTPAPMASCRRCSRSISV